MNTVPPKSVGKTRNGGCLLGTVAGIALLAVLVYLNTLHGFDQVTASFNMLPLILFFGFVALVSGVVGLVQMSRNANADSSPQVPTGKNWEKDD